MTATLLLTGLARQYLAERRAEAVEIVTAGDRFTPSQRALAWAVLTGMGPHMRAPQAADRLARESASGGGDAVGFEGDVA